MAEYYSLDEERWAGFGRNILKEKGSEKQKELLQVCRAGKYDFIKYMRGHSLHTEDNNIPIEYKFSEREFLYPPQDTQRIIWDKCQDISAETMASCNFWGYIIINMIKDDFIEPQYLAAELNGETKTGIYTIDNALMSGEESMDKCVRRILRSMCNPIPRGKRIVFNDFYLGKAYWRWHWANKMSKIINLKFEKILEIFDESYYAEFSAKMHSGKSYISSKNIFGGLLLYLQSNQQGKITSDQLKKLIDKISYLSAWKAIEAQEPDVNQKEIQEIAKTL